MAPLGSISSFTLANRAGYSCYVRAAYCTKDKAGVRKVTLTERLGNHLNLGDSEVRSLKDVGIPDGSEVQLVIELIAGGNPMRMAEESYTYTESSFRTASFQCSGTVFNPKVERVIRRPPPPPADAMTVLNYGSLSTPDLPEYNEKTPINGEKGFKRHQSLASSDGSDSWLSWLCC